MQDPTRHARERGWIESILRRLPGFHGYLEKHYRRESDELLRNWLAEGLQRGKADLDTWGRALLAAGRMDRLPEVEAIRKSADRALNRLRSAPEGYSGWFDFVQIDLAELETLYAHDAALAETVESWREAAAQAAKAEAVSVEPAALRDPLNQILRSLDERDDLLRGMRSG